LFVVPPSLNVHRDRCYRSVIITITLKNLDLALYEVEVDYSKLPANNDDPTNGTWQTLIFCVSGTHNVAVSPMLRTGDIVLEAQPGPEYDRANMEDITTVLPDTGRVLQGATLEVKGH